MKIMLDDSYIDLELITEIIKKDPHTFRVVFVGGEVKTYYSKCKMGMTAYEFQETGFRFKNGLDELIKLWSENQSKFITIKL